MKPLWWPEIISIPYPIIPEETWTDNDKNLTVRIGYPIPINTPIPCFYIPVQIGDSFIPIFGEAPSDALCNALTHAHDKITEILGDQAQLSTPSTPKQPRNVTQQDNSTKINF